MCHVSAPTADGQLARARAALQEAAEALAGLDPAELGEGSLGESVLDLMQVRRQIDGALAVVGERFAHSSEWSADGARDALGWIRGRTHEGFGPVRALMEIARGARMHPEMGDALRRGEVGVRHMKVLSEVSGEFPRLAKHLEAAARQVVDLARGCEPVEFRRSLRALCHRLDPLAAAEDSRHREREFYFRASTLLDGHVRVDGMLPCDVGALLIAALESARRCEETVEPTPQGDVDVLGTPEALDPVDPRRVGQRNVEALHRILTLAAAADLPSVAGMRPQVNVTVSAETLAAEPSAGVDCGWLERFGVPSQPITTETARRLSCDASLRPLILDAQGGLTAFGTASRVVAPSMRALVVRRDRHCRFAGCRARIDEVHHVIFFSRGGPTSSENLLGLCWYHHHLVHEGGWQLAGDANADIKGTGPDGRIWVTGPPGG